MSRIFLWFGADFVRPHRMPAFTPLLDPGRNFPVAGSEVVEWIKATDPAVGFLPYNWGLGRTLR